MAARAPHAPLCGFDTPIYLLRPIYPFMENPGAHIGVPLLANPKERHGTLYAKP